MSALFDPGLQPERTRLAWQRTVLVLAGAWVLGMRVLSPVAGPWSLLVGAAGLAVCAALVVAVRRRARAVDRALAGDERLPGAALLLLVAGVASTASVAVLGMVAVVR